MELEKKNGGELVIA